MSPHDPALAKLECELAVIQGLLQKYADWLKSVRDPVKIADYKLHRNFGQSQEGYLKDRISRHYCASEIRQLEQELSSPDIDRAPPVTVIEEIETETSPAKVLPSHSYHNSLPMPFPPPRHTTRQLSRRQYVEELLQSARDSQTARDARILQHERELPRWKKILDALPGYEPDKAQKEPPGELGGARTPPAPDEPKPVALPVEPAAPPPAPASLPVDAAARSPEPAIDVAQPVEPNRGGVADSNRPGRAANSTARPKQGRVRSAGRARSPAQEAAAPRDIPGGRQEQRAGAKI